MKQPAPRPSTTAVASYTPFQWIRLMTPTLGVLFVVLSLFVYAEGWLLAGH